MAAPSLTYTLTNGTTADASQVQQNFTDLLNGYTDGTKDLSISALTCAGTATFNGHVNLGNSSADDLTITASLASDLPVKTTGTYNLGGASTGLLSIYLAASADADTARILAAAHTADRTYTIPDGGANMYFMLTPSSTNGVSAEGSFTATYAGVSGSVTDTWYYRRYGDDVTIQTSANKGFTKDSNTGTVTVTGAPASILPTTTVAAGFFGGLYNNSVTTGQVHVTTSGFTLYRTTAEDLYGGNVTNNSVGRCTFSYLVR